MAGIESRHGIALFDGRCPDQQIIGRKGDALGRLLSAQLARDLGRGVGYRVYRDMLL